MNWKNRYLLPLLVLPFIVFLNSLDNPFVLDDLSKIVENPDIRSLMRLPERLVYPYTEYQVLNRNDPSRPLVFATYAVNYAISELQPWSYHLFDLFFHILIGVLIFLLCSQWYKTLEIKNSDRWAQLTALLFLLHPLNSGTVIYAYGRSDVLSALLILSALYFFLYSPWQKISPWLSIFLFSLALLTKQSSIIFPLLLIGTIYLFSEQSQKKTFYLYTLPFFALVPVYLLARYKTFGAIGDLEAFGKLWDLKEYASIQPLVVCKYLKLFFWPQGFAIDHFILPENTPEKMRILGIAVLSLVIIVAYFVGRKMDFKFRNIYLWGLGLYALALLPTSSILPTVDAMVERRTYLSNIGLCVGIVVVLMAWQKRKPKFNLQKILCAFIFVFAGFSIWRNHIFDDQKKIWLETLETYSISIRALNNLSLLYLKDKDYDQAIHLLDFIANVYDKDSFSRSNLASIYADPEFKGFDAKKAESLFYDAIRLRPSNFEAHYGLARMFQIQGRSLEAEKYYLKTLEINPLHTLAYNNLALLYQSMGKVEQAQELFKKGLAVDPESKLLNENMNLQGPSGGQQEIPVDQVPSEIIIRTYTKALATDPNNLQIRKGFAEFCFARQLPCAKEQYQWLSQKEPGNLEFKQRAQ